ncbi:MAG: hypothetical protein HUU37_11205, partial [Bdellovibrionales bacterium]|nr:hypothetical protein [Bdellovibrionales bacterium]
DRSGGRKEKAAQVLGINRRTLYRKEREYGWVTDAEASDEFSPLPRGEIPEGLRV